MSDQEVRRALRHLLAGIGWSDLTDEEVHHLRAACSRVIAERRAAERRLAREVEGTAAQKRARQARQVMAGMGRHVVRGRGPEPEGPELIHVLFHGFYLCGIDSTPPVAQPWVGIPDRLHATCPPCKARAAAAAAEAR